MAQQIVITIGPDGATSFDAQGFKGSSCEKATEQLELVLGGESKRKKKPEYHMPPAINSGSVKGGVF